MTAILIGALLLLFSVGLLLMVKTAEQVRRKMKDRVSGAGQYLKEGLGAAPNPVDVLLADPQASQNKQLAGVQEAARRGTYIAGLKKAKAAGSWEKSHDRAGRHFEERAQDMVDRSMMDYDARAAVIERVKKELAALPRTTRDQRIAYAQAYQRRLGEEFDKLYGRSK